MNPSQPTSPLYPSGIWEGFWEQKHYGRQPMTDFLLRFTSDGEIHGHGIDIVGRFLITGHYDRHTGQVEWIKQYIGQHPVHYQGLPDGEGSILGTWRVATAVAGQVYVDHGAFALRPRLAKPGGNEPIYELPL